MGNQCPLLHFILSQQVTKTELLDWYCKEIANDMDSQDELLERRQVAEKVIERLAFSDNIIIPLNKSGLGSKKGEGAEETDDPVLVVHPNYVIEQ